ncbi:MAG: anti-sigma factor [Rhodobacteraceae bacterium]|nr:anti-sigma factor [Paracoccaceae bacterium]
MSDADDPQAPEGDDMLAAEYVLGTLPLPERLAVQRRLRNDDAFAARVAAWEDRLAALNDSYAEAPAPDLLPAIEARLFGVAPRRPSRLRLWLGALGGAVVALALVAIVLVSVPLPQGPTYVATLTATDQAVVFKAGYDPATETLTLTRTAGPGPAAGHDYQLWSIGADGVPKPLGLVSAPQDSQHVPGLAPGIVLAVSVEPAGGSPNGKPTQALAAGPITAL